MNKFIIDHIKNFEIDLDDKPVENLHALDYSRTGIFALVDQVSKMEEEISKTIMGSAVLYISSSSKNTEILSCIFQWFAITVSNYVRTIALINLMNEKKWKTEDIKNNKEEIKKYCVNYLKEVIPEVYNWRNKVAAHFAITDPKDENIGMLEFSLFSQISFSAPHYFVGGFNWSSAGEESNIIKWSLIEIFEQRLVPRYWPKN